MISNTEGGIAKFSARRWLTSIFILFSVQAWASDYVIRQIADEDYLNNQVRISDTGLVVWQGFRMRPSPSTTSEIFIHTNGVTVALTEGVFRSGVGNHDPQVYSNKVVWVSNTGAGSHQRTLELTDPPLDPDHQPELDARWHVAADSGEDPMQQRMEHVAGAEYSIREWRGEDDTRSRRSPSGHNEIMLWDGNDIRQITADNRNDLGPSLWGDTIAWQKARGWPFGWEIMVWTDGVEKQMTTNFVYDMAPRVHNRQVVWYGWDGNDFEIYLYDEPSGEIRQITDNEYDDMSPQIWDGVIVWEGIERASSDIFMWRDGEIRKLSDNIEDDINVRLWNGQAVWQGFDGDFFQIYHFDGTQTRQLTNTRYDNVHPDIRDGVITWMGYVDNFDAEIFVWTGGPDPIRLTDNDYEDMKPRTAGGRIVWRADVDGKSHIYLAEPAGR